MTLEILTSDTLAPFRHGFFTRRGGASSGVFAGLNCGFGSSDQREIVAINRARVAAAMQVAPDALRGVNQVHSNIAVAARPQAVVPPPEADAQVTAAAGLALGILTADCMPILLGAPASGVVGAAHAGWRGALGGVIEAALAAMERQGARRDDIRAVIGPCISQRAYEVGPDILDAFCAESDGARRFFAAGAGDRLHLDLPGYGLFRLRRAGVAAAEWVGHCTYHDAGRFYSYRRAAHRKEADYGRLISVIRT